VSVKLGDRALSISALFERKLHEGNATDRRNVIYGVYRGGTWLLDETGSGAPTRTVNFGGLSQDAPLLIPHWNSAGRYSLAIYRDGTWFIKPDPTFSTIVTVQFGAIGDIPLVRGASG
jgi:hypothetical protein